MEHNSRIKGLVLLMLLAITGFTKAQTHVFAPVGAEWHYGKQTMFTWGYIRINVTNDTIIDGHACSILHKEERGFNYYNHNLYHFDLGYEYIAQENDSVLIYRKGRFYKLFDFNANIGDSWIIPGGEEDGRVIVCGKGTEIVNGNELRFILIVDEFGSTFGYGNELVGDTLFPPDTIKVLERIGPIGSYLLPVPRNILDYDGECGILRCYSDDIVEVNYSWPFVYCDYIDDDHVGFEENVQISNYGIYPNPTTGMVTIMGKDLKTAEVFNALGQHMANDKGNGEQLTVDISDLPAGVYFVNITDSEGRKCVKKVVKE